MPEGNNNENQNSANQKCPFCHNGLIIKNSLLFCPKCALFIGDPKTFTGTLTNTDKIKNEAIEREEEQIAKKKGRAIWQTIIILLILIASFAIYQFKLWTFVIRIDYSSIKEIQKELPFTIYLPKKIPFGYNLDTSNTGVHYVKSGKIGSVDIVYKKRAENIIKISLFPITAGFTPDNGTAGELFSMLSSGKNLNKISTNEQDIYTSKVDIFLTEENFSLYRAIAITTYDDLIIKIEYTGLKEITENELRNIAGSLKPIEAF